MDSSLFLLPGMVSLAGIIDLGILHAKSMDSNNSPGEIACDYTFYVTHTERDMGVYGIAVLGFFSCGISVILILTCGIAVSSSSAVCGFSSF